MKLYMMTTQDIYELPLAVAGTIDELARMTGAKKTTIAESISRRKSRQKQEAKSYSRPKWHKVEVEEDISD